MSLETHYQNSVTRLRIPIENSPRLRRPLDRESGSAAKPGFGCQTGFGLSASKQVLGSLGANRLRVWPASKLRSGIWTCERAQTLLGIADPKTCLVPKTWFGGAATLFKESAPAARREVKGNYLI